jgi:hypothetical protein
MVVGAMVGGTMVIGAVVGTMASISSGDGIAISVVSRLFAHTVGTRAGTVERTGNCVTHESLNTLTLRMRER